MMRERIFPVRIISIAWMICGHLARKSRWQEILFCSRTRGDNWEGSDVDEIEIVPTLLMFDVVDLDSGCNEELRAEIERDGVILYEAG